MTNATQTTSRTTKRNPGRTDVMNAALRALYREDSEIFTDTAIMRAINVVMEIAYVTARGESEGTEELRAMLLADMADMKDPARICLDAIYENAELMAEVAACFAWLRK